MKKFIIFIFIIILFLLVAIAACLGIYLYRLNSELPKVADLKNFSYKVPTLIYDSNNEILAELGEEVRYPVTYDKIPKDLVNALVAVEDSRFYEHEGIDALSIIRAFFTNLKAGHIVEGGSTLTQQLAKILYLTPEKKLERKVKEAILAYKLDSFLTKQKILELYLNQVYFGRGSYGVESAAKNYFGKDVWDLTLTESALLAALPKAPGIYAPHLDYSKSLSRRNYVLLRMFEEGYITEEQYKNAISADIKFLSKKPQRIRMAEYFIDYLLSYLQVQLKNNDIKNSGLKIYSTLRIDYQNMAERAIKNNLFNVSKREGYFGPIANTNDKDLEEKLLRFSYLKKYNVEFAYIESVDKNFVDIKVDENMRKLDIRDNTWARPYGSQKLNLEDFREILKRNDIILVTEAGSGHYMLYQEPLVEGSLLAIKPSDGSILAMVGGFDFNKSMFNRATMAIRQVGSLFKPIVYAAAIDRGYNLNHQVFDAPVIKRSSLNEYWKPENFEERFYGFTTLKTGLTKSRNVVTIKLADEIGIKTILDYAKAFGISSPLERDLSVSIGSGSVTLLEMVYAFSAFPNLGNIYKPKCVKEVFDRTGEIIYKQDPQIAFKPIKEETAHIMTDALINVIENGTGRGAKHMPRFIGGKTGSTNEYRDAWFIGFLPNLAVGVWTGFDDFRSIGSIETGSKASLPAWTNFVESILDKVDFAVFPISKNVVYKKVDETTNSITDAINLEDFTFEPFAEDLGNKQKDATNN